MKFTGGRVFGGFAVLKDSEHKMIRIDPVVAKIIRLAGCVCQRSLDVICERNCLNLLIGCGLSGDLVREQVPQLENGVCSGSPFGEQAKK